MRDVHVRESACGNREGSENLIDQIKKESQDRLANLSLVQIRKRVEVKTGSPKLLYFVSFKKSVDANVNASIIGLSLMANRYALLP